MFIDINATVSMLSMFFRLEKNSYVFIHREATYCKNNVEAELVS